MNRSRLIALLTVLCIAVVPAVGALPAAGGGLDVSDAEGNPVATDEVTYQAYGRVWSDPQGCLVPGGQSVSDQVISPWAKGNGCARDFLSYEEAVEGAKFLARRFPDLVQVIRLDGAYDNPDMRSAGIARTTTIENGDLRAFGRDRSPLYMFKVTNRNSPVAEADRLHFTYGLAIHGLERQGAEGGLRAMEDLVTWAACEMDDDRAASTPACDIEGPFPKEIIESDTDRPVPTAGEVVDRTVSYFMLNNPDGWRVGDNRPTEFRDGSPNLNFKPGSVYWRGNGHGVDLNRDWPALGYTLKSHQPWSEPETRYFGEALEDIRDRTSDGHFAAGIDLHGMLDAYAFSFTLLGADQRDYRKNAITVETSLRTWEDQTERLRWSPWVADSTGDGEPDGPCFEATGGPTRGHVPSCVADEWGTVFDTLGYTVTGALGFWIDDARVGLGGVGINNEMALSAAWEPALVQTHIDGNKGLIYSQIAALMFEEEVAFEPGGRVGYVENPLGLTEDGWERPANPGLPSQGDIDVLLPCQGEAQQQLPGNCGPGEFSTQGTTGYYEFEVLGPDDGVWNGGMIARSTTPQQQAGLIHPTAGVTLERYDEDEGEWVTKKTLNRTATTYNDPEPGRWRASFAAVGTSSPRRLEISFDRHTAEAHPGQLPIDASSMDFYTELNDYVPDGSKLEAMEIDTLIDEPGLLGAVDTLIVTNHLGDADYLADELGLAPGQVEQYFAGLAAFAEDGGNLVLTDAAVQALPALGLVGDEHLHRLSGIAGAYNFQVDEGVTTYEDPDAFPLAAGLDLPGAAELENGRRQAVEPTPLGYNPDAGGDHARMPFWGVDRDAWETACDREPVTRCTTSTTERNGDLVNIGEVAYGDGMVRIVGALLPDPLRTDDARADNRFGLGSYAITYTAYLVFENLIDYERP